MECQVQLAHKHTKEHFENGLYSRKFDGKRMYVLDGVAYSRANKVCREAPIRHILDELESVSQHLYTLKNQVASLGFEINAEKVFDGEVLYFEEGFAEDFKRTISLTSRIDRHPDCKNLYYVIFDMINTDDFILQQPDEPFIENYNRLLTVLGAQELREDLYSTMFPHILIAKQTTDMSSLMEAKNFSNWEGLMYRNGDAPYEYKRTKNLLKIKKMQDIELEVTGFKEGIGKHEGRLGAVLCSYKGSTVAVGSGFDDATREAIWKTQDQLLDQGVHIKVRYFEESCNAKGEVSLRFPTYICFRDLNLEEYV